MKKIKAWFGLAVFLLGMHYLPAMAQGVYRPAKVVKVTEGKKLSRYESKDSGSCPEGTKIIFVTMNISGRITYIDNECLELMGGDKLFNCTAIGDPKKGYFPYGAALFRKDSVFVKLNPIARIKESDLTAAFIVPDTMCLDSLKLVFSFLGREVPLDTVQRTQLQYDLTVNVKNTSVHEVKGPFPTSLFTATIEVKNDGTYPYPVHAGSFRLGEPDAPSAQQPHWYWSKAHPLINASHLSITIPPGESKVIRLNFEVDSDFSQEKSKFGFFDYFQISLQLQP